MLTARKARPLRPSSPTRKHSKPRKKHVLPMVGAAERFGKLLPAPTVLALKYRTRSGQAAFIEKFDKEVASLAKFKRAGWFKYLADAMNAKSSFVGSNLSLIAAMQIAKDMRKMDGKGGSDSAARIEKVARDGFKKAKNNYVLLRSRALKYMAM